ncbi:hypothetical protein B0T19DRAFT_223338 [Cercophora scortea]|uniref:Secreted protein n=1 Tax=Cercophora scortea TaxID=314031 RepID=A0AAE0M991_9PEZI|nr:hypothetical protein B0T19DRAFT_223338 [Cercophora scortea]
MYIRCIPVYPALTLKLTCWSFLLLTPNGYVDRSDKIKPRRPDFWCPPGPCFLCFEELHLQLSPRHSNRWADKLPVSLIYRLIGHGARPGILLAPQTCRARSRGAESRTVQGPRAGFCSQPGRLGGQRMTCGYALAFAICQGFPQSLSLGGHQCMHVCVGCVCYSRHRKSWARVNVMRRPSTFDPGRSVISSFFFFSSSS